MAVAKYIFGKTYPDKPKAPDKPRVRDDPSPEVESELQRLHEEYEKLNKDPGAIDKEIQDLQAKLREWSYRNLGAEKSYPAPSRDTPTREPYRLLEFGPGLIDPPMPVEWRRLAQALQDVKWDQKAKASLWDEWQNTSLQLQQPRYLYNAMIARGMSPYMANYIVTRVYNENVALPPPAVQVEEDKVDRLMEDLMKQVKLRNMVYLMRTTMGAGPVVEVGDPKVSGQSSETPPAPPVPPAPPASLRVAGYAAMTPSERDDARRKIRELQRSMDEERALITKAERQAWEEWTQARRGPRPLG